MLNRVLRSTRTMAKAFKPMPSLFQARAFAMKPYYFDKQDYDPTVTQVSDSLIDL